MSMKQVGGIWGVVALAIAGYALYNYLTVPTMLQEKPREQGG